MKVIITWLSGKFFLRDEAGILSGQDSSILPVRVANHGIGVSSFWPITKAPVDPEGEYSLIWSMCAAQKLKGMVFNPFIWQETI